MKVRWITPVILLLSVGVVELLANAQTVTYSYDTNGRLVCVRNPSGTTAVYSYDVVGNLTSISTNTPCPVTQPTPAPSSSPPTPGVTPTP